MAHLGEIREAVEDDARTSVEILAELEVQGYLMLDALADIAKELKIMNLHLSIVTNENITRQEVE
jgi:hypothetical protein